MSYDVAEYSDYEYEKHVYWNGRDPDEGYMDDKYGRRQWSNHDSDDELRADSGVESSP